MAILYRHIRLDQNKPFYIGIGNDEKRAFEKSHRNKHWHNIAKNGYDVEILFEDLSWEEACQKEKEFIALYGRSDLGTGILCNKTDGGEGAKRAIRSDETREKLSAANSGEKNPNFGKSATAETRAKLSAASKGRKLSAEHRAKISEAGKGRKKGPRSAEHSAKIVEANKGKTRSAETRAKLSEAHKGKRLSDEHRVKLSEAHKGKTHSAETLAKMSEAQKGRTHTDETLAKMSEAAKGRTFSAETRAKMSKARKGIKRGPYITKNRRKMSEEAKNSKINFISQPMDYEGFGYYGIDKEILYGE